MQVRFGQQSPYGQAYRPTNRTGQQPRFGALTELTWHTKNRDIPVKFNEKTAQKPDGFVKSDVQAAIQTVETKYSLLDTTPEGATVVLGKEEANKPKTIFGFFGSTNGETVIYNPNRYAGNTDQKVVENVLSQIAFHLNNNQLK